MNKEIEKKIELIENLALRIFRSCADENVKPNYIHWSDASNLMLIVDELRAMQQTNESLERGLLEAIQR